MDLRTQSLHITDVLRDMTKQARLCDFCKLRLDIGKTSFSVGDPSSTVSFDRFKSTLRLNGDHTPVLSLLSLRRGSGALIYLRTEEHPTAM